MWGRLGPAGIGAGWRPGPRHRVSTHFPGVWPVCDPRSQRGGGGGPGSWSSQGCGEHGPQQVHSGHPPEMLTRAPKTELRKDHSGPAERPAGAAALLLPLRRPGDMSALCVAEPARKAILQVQGVTNRGDRASAERGRHRDRGALSGRRSRERSRTRGAAPRDRGRGAPISVLPGPWGSWTLGPGLRDDGVSRAGFRPRVVRPEPGEERAQPLPTPQRGLLGTQCSWPSVLTGWGGTWCAGESSPSASVSRWLCLPRGLGSGRCLAYI